ncbi:uncharacterized protein [Rutidosis leptorrhynchoides]|uniref:uncharacterized protein n=1 Tax=Rutidosis leptorrhynchoides TaxID=125765 RepID=UPI003A99CA31
MRGRGRGRNSYRGRGRGRGRGSFNKSTIVCYNCHGLGHFQYECPKWNDEANYVDEDHMLLMTYEKVQNYNMHNVWFLDSGCSNHMCGDHGTFTELDENFKHTVRLGNDSRLQVHGKERISLPVGGIKYVVRVVYYVPELNNNLLSVGQLQEKGLAILFKHNTCSIFHDQRG